MDLKSFCKAVLIVVFVGLGNSGFTWSIAGPQVSITSPASTSNSPVAIRASISGPRAIKKVVVNISPIGFSQTFNYSNLPKSISFSYDWTPSTAGSYTIQVVATDTLNKTASASVVTTVSLPDAQAPAATVTSPTSGQTVSGMVSLSATASDNIGVTKTELYVDGTKVAENLSNSVNFSWNSASVPDGSHSIQAKAYDMAGNVGTSSAVSITVAQPDVTPPSVSITAPASGVTVSGSNVQITAQASDNIGVARVEFYADGNLIGTKTASPYTITWDSTKVSNANHYFQALVFDAANNQGGSALVSVTVSNVSLGDEICDGVDNNGDGVIDEGQLGDMGFCTKGTLRPLNTATNLFNQDWLINVFDQAYNNGPSNLMYTKAYLNTNAALTPKTNNCGMPEYNIYSGLGALITMYQATDGSKSQDYLNEAKTIADKMIAAATQMATTPEVRMGWDASGCIGQGPIQNELQGIKNLTRLARAMKEKGDVGWDKYSNFAMPMVNYYSTQSFTQWYFNTVLAQAALDLWKMQAVSGDKYLQIASALITKLRTKGYIVEDVKGSAKYLMIKQSTLPGAAFETTDNANRFADFIAQLHQDSMDSDRPNDLPELVNTLLFRVWEPNPAVEITDPSTDSPPLRYYPDLFKTRTDGTNTCWGPFPPYDTRMGFGWHLLGRFDDRVRSIMQQYTLDLFSGTAVQVFPPGTDTGCAKSNFVNESYSDLTSFIAESLYDMKLAGPLISFEKGERTVSPSDPDSSRSTGSGSSASYWKYQYVAPTNGQKLKKMVVFFSGGEMNCGMGGQPGNYQDTMDEYSKNGYVSICAQTYPDGTEAGNYPFYREATRVNSIMNSIRSDSVMQGVWTGEYLLFSGVSHGATAPVISMARSNYDQTNPNWKGTMKTAACFFDGIYDVPTQVTFCQTNNCALSNLADPGALPIERELFRYCWPSMNCSDYMDKGGAMDSITTIPASEFFITDWKLISAGADTMMPCSRDVVVNSPVKALCDNMNNSGTHHCEYLDLPFSPDGYTHTNVSGREAKECRTWFDDKAK